MTNSHVCKRPDARLRSRAMLRFAALAILLTVVLTGCGPEPPEATVEGLLSRNGEPLDNCLVTFHPENEEESQGLFAADITDEQGRYELRRSDQLEGCPLGPHRVTVQDLSVSTGVVRRDHGTVEAEDAGGEERTPVRRSRIPKNYSSIADTSLKFEIQAGSQSIDLDVK